MSTNSWFQISSTWLWKHWIDKDIVMCVLSYFQLMILEWNHEILETFYYFLNQLMETKYILLMSLRLCWKSALMSSLIIIKVALFLNFPKQQNLSVRQSQFQVEKEIFIFLPLLFTAKADNYTRYTLGVAFAKSRTFCGLWFWTSFY